MTVQDGLRSTVTAGTRVRLRDGRTGIVLRLVEMESGQLAFVRIRQGLPLHIGPIAELVADSPAEPMEESNDTAD